MSDIYQLQFNRISERLALKTLRKAISDQLSFPLEDIYLQSPSPMYVNTRTETTNKQEELRYPNIAIFSIKESQWSALGNILDEQSTSLDGLGLQTFYECRFLTQQTLELCLQTTTKKDYMDYKNRLKIWFQDNRTLRFDDDTLPNGAGSMSILLLDIKDDTFETPYEVNFTVELNYRIYKEFLAYLLLNFEIQAIAEQNLDIGNEDNVYEEWWTNQDPYLD